MLLLLLYSIILPHGQPRTVLRGRISICGELMVLRKELIMTDDSPLIIMQRMTTFYRSHGVALV